MINFADLENDTLRYGGEYGLFHSRRIIRLAAIIGENMTFNFEAIQIAALLHDWGACPAWKKDGVDHAVRSAEIAAEYLKDRVADRKLKETILDCIRNHHNGNMDKSDEARLFSDADGLDFLGTVGMLRDFATRDRDMRKSILSARSRMEKIPAILIFEKSRRMAEKKIERMKLFMGLFEEESFGIY